VGVHVILCLLCEAHVSPPEGEVMEPEIGQWDRHRIMASKPLAPTGTPVFVWDIETWGLDATAFAFGCVHQVSTGEERTFFTKEALREYLESEAPCIVYAHNSSKYDTLCLFSTDELYNADKIANGTRIYQSLVNATRARPSRRVHVVNLGLDPEEALEMGLPVEHLKEKERAVGSLHVIAHACPQNDYLVWFEAQQLDAHLLIDTGRGRRKVDPRSGGGA